MDSGAVTFENRLRCNNIDSFVWLIIYQGLL